MTRPEPVAASPADVVTPRSRPKTTAGQRRSQTRRPRTSWLMSVTSRITSCFICQAETTRCTSVRSTWCASPKRESHPVPDERRDRRRRSMPGATEVTAVARVRLTGDASLSSRRQADGPTHDACVSPARVTSRPTPDSSPIRQSDAGEERPRVKRSRFDVRPLTIEVTGRATSPSPW